LVTFIPDDGSSGSAKENHLSTEDNNRTTIVKPTSAETEKIIVKPRQRIRSEPEKRVGP